MKRNRYDDILNKMMTRIERVTDRMSVEFKNAKPFDKTIPDPKQRLLQYSMMPEEQKQFARQNFPEFLEYEDEMTALRGKYNG